MEEREGNMGERKGLGNKKVQRKEKVANHFKRDLVAWYTYNINTVFLKINSILFYHVFHFSRYKYLNFHESFNLYKLYKNREILQFIWKNESEENDRIFRNNTIFKNFKIDNYNIYNK